MLDTLQLADDIHRREWRSILEQAKQPKTHELRERPLAERVH
jgi:hypothetical protein